MEQLDPALVVVRGHPTDAELAALLCSLAELSTTPPPSVPVAEPRVWRRTSWRSHSHLLHVSLPASTDPGHRSLAIQPSEES